MRRVAVVWLVIMAFAALATDAGAQARRRRAPARTPAPPPPPVVAPADVTCPHVLGRGVKTRLIYCDVVTGRNPADGVRIRIPPHDGNATLRFSLHNRHLYSDELVRAGRGYARYLATIGALAPDGMLLGRAIVLSEVRTAADLLDRIEGETGPRGVKAMAPAGSELISIDIPEEVEEVSLLGEKLEVVRMDAREVHTAPGRPIASVSDLKVEYRARPVTRKPRR
jgi:hypothetical protein